MRDGLAVRYNREEPVSVDSPAELDALLDRIAATPRFEEFPVMVEVAGGGGERTLDVGVGRPYSVLVWSDWAAGEVLYSAGSVRVAEVPAYSYGGTWTEYDASWAVPLETARRAVREFCESGAKPLGVEWLGR